jgi:hypothetical protein
MRPNPLLSLLLSILFCLGSHFVVQAATWVVDPGGAGDATDITGGLELASSGDTVLVLVGTYNENLRMPEGVILIGAAGAYGTVIQPVDAFRPVISC